MYAHGFRALSFRFSSQNPLSIFIPYHACHMPPLLHSVWFDHPGEYVDDYQSSARSRSIDIVAINSRVSLLTYLKIRFKWRKTCYCLDTARFVAAPSKCSVSVNIVYVTVESDIHEWEREQENWRHRWENSVDTPLKLARMTRQILKFNFYKMFQMPWNM